MGRRSRPSRVPTHPTRPGFWQRETYWLGPPFGLLPQGETNPRQLSNPTLDELLSEIDRSASRSRHSPSGRANQTVRAPSAGTRCRGTRAPCKARTSLLRARACVSTMSSSPRPPAPTPVSTAAASAPARIRRTAPGATKARDLHRAPGRRDDGRVKSPSPPDTAGRPSAPPSKARDARPLRFHSGFHRTCSPSGVEAILGGEGNTATASTRTFRAEPTAPPPERGRRSLAATTTR